MATQPVRPTASSIEPIQARGFVPLTVSETGVPEWIMYMPGGTHTIHARRGRQSVTVTVQVDSNTAAVIEQQRRELTAADPHRPWFDFDHDAKAASAWPLEFAWRSDNGAEGVYARVEWSKAGSEAVAGKAYRAFSPTFWVDDQKPAHVIRVDKIMGGLVNDPAFRQINPLWSHNAADNPHTTMDEKELAALQAKLSQLEKENEELKAKAASSEKDDAIAAKAAEIDSLKTKLDAAEAAISAQRKRDAKSAVDAAVARGAIPPKDDALQGRWLQLIEANPDNAELLAKLPGRDLTAGVLKGAGRIEVQDEPVKAFEAMTEPGKGTDPRLVTAHYRKHRDAIRQAIQAANAWTNLTYTILSQEVLEAFVYAMTPIRAFSTNLSADAVQRGDKVKVLYVSSASAAADFAGTYTMQALTAEGKDVTIDKRKYVSWSLTTEELATQPQLTIDRFSRQKGNALAYAVLRDIWSLILAANYGNTGHTGPGVGGDKVTEAVADFDTDTVALMKNCCDEENWPDVERSLVISPGADYGLMKDADVIGTAGYDASSVLKTGRYSQVFGFTKYVSNAIPANGENLYGFACHPDAILVAMRSLIPEEGVALRPTVQPFTDPETGLTVVRREWFDADNDVSKRVFECNYGYLVGNATGIKRIVSS